MKCGEVTFPDGRHETIGGKKQKKEGLGFACIETGG